MNHLKLFEELNIDKEEFPEDGYELNSREKQILEGLVGKPFLLNFKIRKEDNYYYSYNYGDIYHKFDGFSELKDYLLCRYYIFTQKYNELLELLQSTNLDPSFDDNYLIRISIKRGYIKVVKLLLKDPRVDPSDNKSIVSAAFNGHIEVVKMLLKDPRVDPSVDNNFLIIWASSNGYKELVKLLLKDPRVDPIANDNYPITRAIRFGHIEVVKILLKDSRVCKCINRKNINGVNYIKSAISLGHTNIVKLLIKNLRVDPIEIIECAIENKNTEIVNLLIQDSRVREFIEKRNLKI